MKTLTAILVAMITGCASAPAKEQTYDELVACASRHNTECANNAGVVAFNRGDRATAQRWWTATAEEGSDFGIARLKQFGMPIPPVKPYQSSPTVVCTRVGPSSICN